MLLNRVKYYLIKFLNASGSFNLLLNSKTNNYNIYFKRYMNIQSAENCKGFSETIRQLSGFFLYFTTLIWLIMNIWILFNGVAKANKTLNFSVQPKSDRRLERN